MQANPDSANSALDERRAGKRPAKPHPKLSAFLDSSAPDQLVDTDTFAKHACISPNYARQLRVFGGGPRFIKLTEKTVRYRTGDVLDWIASRPRVASTSELAVA